MTVLALLGQAAGQTKGWAERIRRVRVALNVEQFLYRAPGGIGRYTSKLLTLLPRLAPEDSVIAFTARHRRAAIERAYAQFGLDPAPLPIRFPLPRPLLYDMWNVLGVPRLEWWSKALGASDVVHAPSLAVPPKSNHRLVVTIHDLAPVLFPEAFPRHGRWFHARGLAAAARRADLVITGSHAAASEITEHSTIASDRVRVVPYGVDATVAAAEDVASTRQRHGLSGRPYVLWVGSLEPRKNLGTLVAAFARLVADERTGHQLVLVGPSGWLDDALISTKDRQRLGRRLHIVGRAGDAELQALYAGADVFAFPSRHEGFGLPVLEAMVQGTPVVCSDIAALREVTAGAARLVGAGDIDGWAQALHDVLTDDAGRRRLADAGRERAAQFSWEQTIRATRAVYQEALAG